MKRKINIQLAAIAVIAICSTMVFMAVVCYDLFRRQILEDLKAYAHLLQSTAALEDVVQSRFDSGGDKLRITVVDGGGQVVFESYGPEAGMGSHADRPEIKKALENGEGWAVRKSSTLRSNAFYYAVRTKEGGIIRVSKEAESMWSILAGAFPAAMLIAAALLFFCLAIAHFLTKSLVAPIEKIACHMGNLEGVDTYEELAPFVETIRRQHEDILRSAGMRQEFTANVTHELKTPLASISGYAELIENGMAPEGDVRRFAGEIRRNSSRLLTLINDVLRLSELDAMEKGMRNGEADAETGREAAQEPDAIKGETGMKEREAAQEVDLCEIAETCVDMLRFYGEQHGVELIFTGTLALVWGEKRMMEELVYNLCDNAIRYNNRGGQVKVTVGTKEGSAFLVVEDTGIGIPKECQERIFERFYRVDKSRSKSTGGTGLGLAIVKHIAVKSRAQLQLESQVGKGTKVTVRFNGHAPCAGGKTGK